MFDVRTDEMNLADGQEGVYKVVTCNHPDSVDKMIFSRVRLPDGSMGVSLKYVIHHKKSNKKRRKRK